MTLTLIIGITNFGGILQTLKILCFAICVEDYHKLIQTQIQQIAIKIYTLFGTFLIKITQKEQGL
jgi:hypothetical protein